MDDLIRNLAETLVYIREHGPKITPEEIERRKYYPAGYPPSWEEPLPDEEVALTFWSLYRSSALKEAVFQITKGHVFYAIQHFTDFLETRRRWIHRSISSSDLQAAKQEALHPRSLLAFAFDRTTMDGCMPVASFLYLDEYDIPPWDTWVALKIEHSGGLPGDRSRYLICWVPEWARDWVDDLIALNWEGEYSWVTLKDDQLHIKGWQERWQD